jgi:hypothetical protein
MRKLLKTITVTVITVLLGFWSMAVSMFIVIMVL